MNSGLGLFIDPSLQTGFAVVDLENRYVKTLDCMDYGGIRLKYIKNMKVLYQAFSLTLERVIESNGITFIAMEFINAVFNKNSLEVFRMNNLFLLSLLTISSKIPSLENNIYLIPNPTIRSHILSEMKLTNPSYRTSSLTKSVIRDEVCRYFNIDTKLIKSNYNKSDALAVAYALSIMFRDNNFKSCEIF